MHHAWKFLHITNIYEIRILRIGLYHLLLNRYTQSTMLGLVHIIIPEKGN